MKTYILTAALFLNVAHKQCGNTAMNTDTYKIPACIQARIDEIKKQPRWNPPATVEEYQYNGKRVFLFSADCCDKYNEAVDESCNRVCAPSGGITGKGDRQCLDFAERAKLVRVVWKDERK